VAPAVARVAEATPCFGLSWVTPPRKLELPYEYTFSPAAVPFASMPLGPPRNGIDGLTLPKSAGFNRTNARSLKAHVSGLVSPAASIASHEL
jgi:hypothetical protein